MKLYRWHIEYSHLVAVPEYYEAANLTELRSHLQLTADTKGVRTDRPPIGPLEFRYELNDADEPIVVHSYFTNRHGNRVRFMRVRRDD